MAKAGPRRPASFSVSTVPGAALLPPGETWQSTRGSITGGQLTTARHLGYAVYQWTTHYGGQSAGVADTGGRRAPLTSEWSPPDEPGEAGECGLRVGTGGEDWSRLLQMSIQAGHGFDSARHHCSPPRGGAAWSVKPQQARKKLAPPRGGAAFQSRACSHSCG